MDALSVWLVWCILSLCDSRASSCVAFNYELVCFQGDRGTKGACGGDGPKGEKVRLELTEKWDMVGGRGQEKTMNGKRL